MIWPFLWPPDQYQPLWVLLTYTGRYPVHISWTQMSWLGHLFVSTRKWTIWLKKEHFHKFVTHHEFKWSLNTSKKYSYLTYILWGCWKLKGKMINFQRIHRVYHALNVFRKGRFLCFEEINFWKLVMHHFLAITYFLLFSVSCMKNFCIWVHSSSKNEVINPFFIDVITSVYTFHLFKLLITFIPLVPSHCCDKLLNSAHNL